MAENIRMIAMGCKPDPTRFKVLETKKLHGCTIVLAEYEGCKTFDGKKLMLLSGYHDEFETLDPHFLDEEYAVIGRFIPTERGWEMAEKAAETYCGDSHLLC